MARVGGAGGVVERRAVPAARAELELALVDGAAGARLHAHHERRVLLAKVHLLGVERLGELVAQRRRAQRRRARRLGARKCPVFEKIKQKNKRSVDAF